MRARRGAWPLEVGPGITVWFSTVLVGMLLRAVVLRSFAWPFLAVAATVLAVLLIGWRALASRAPYLHNGSAPDLGAVVDFCDQRFRIGLTEQERDDLIAFLQTL